MLYCEETTAMSYRRWSKKLECMDFRFETMGARVLMNAGLSMPSRCA